MSTTIPTADALRADIRARTAEVRALRKLLRLAEAAEAVEAARRGTRRIPQEQGGRAPEAGKGVAHVS